MKKKQEPKPSLSLGIKHPDVLMNNEINIITATHNRAYILPRAASCVFNQTHTDWKWIIIDDGSFDETSNIVKKFPFQGKITYFKFDTRVGQVGTKNKGLELANKDRPIHIFDDDDVIYPNFYEKMLLYMTTADVAFCNFYVIKEEIKGKELEEITREVIQDWQGFAPGKQKDKPYININRCLFTPGFFNIHEWFPIDQPFCIEWFMLLKAEMAGATFKYVDELLGENHWRYGDFSDNVSFTKNPIDIPPMMEKVDELKRA